MSLEKSYQASIKIKNIYSIIGAIGTDDGVDNIDKNDITEAINDKTVNDS